MLYSARLEASSDLMAEGVPTGSIIVISFEDQMAILCTRVLYNLIKDINYDNRLNMHTIRYFRAK